ncbi:MAG: preprotein translocase subunit YajC, partial [Candidatus Zixiibacteriota bacterium]
GGWRILVESFVLTAIVGAWPLAAPLFAMGQAPGEGGAGGFSGTFGMLIPLFLIMYFIILRPQQKKQKEHKKMLTELRKGDRVVTSGGMFGDIFAFNEKRDSVVLKVGEMKLEFLRSSIAGKARE